MSNNLDETYDDIPMTRLERVYCNDNNKQIIFIHFTNSHPMF
jgi:hypothetical protein